MSFDETKPPAGGLLVSADHRNNFLATRQAGFINFVIDPLFECWPVDDTTMPATWVLSGAGAAVSRDTLASRLGVGNMGPRITFGVASAIGSQEILRTAEYDQFFDARVVTAGVFMHADAIGIAKVRIEDGVDLSEAANTAANPAAPEFIAVEHEVNAAATKLELQVRVDAAGACTFSGAVFLFSDIKPSRFIPSPVLRRTLVHARRGEVFTGEVDRFTPQRPFIVEHVQLDMTAAPGGAAVIADVNQFDGAGAFTSMFTGPGRPRVAAGALQGGASPDGTYNRRCFIGSFGAGVPAQGGRIQTEIDSVGAGPIGDDLNIYVRYKAWMTPRETFTVLP